jgi:tRNA 2-thiouridine synthesizing protein A
MSRIMTMATLDLIGLKCPLPVLRTRKALASASPGARLELRCSDPLAAIDIPHLLSETGDALEASLREGAVLIFHIRKAGGAS